LGTAPAAEATPGYAVRRLRIALGTWIALEATAASDTAARGAIESAYAAIAELAWRLHPLRNGSDVARINAAPPGTRVPIHASSARVLRLAHQIYALTDGVFDPCLPILPGRLGNLELSGDSPAGPAWALCHSPLALDLGGIAKGYAVDCAIDAPHRWRCCPPLCGRSRPYCRGRGCAHQMRVARPRGRHGAGSADARRARSSLMGNQRETAGIDRAPNTPHVGMSSVCQE